MLVWAIWFGVVIASLVALEVRAKVLNRPAVAPLLSRTIWRLQARFPIFGFLLGFIAGGLAVHFFGLLPACNP